MTSLLRDITAGLRDHFVRRSALERRMGELEEVVEELAWRPAGFTAGQQQYECAICEAATPRPGLDAHEAGCIVSVPIVGRQS